MKAQGYCKTSFAYERDAETQVDTWHVIEDQAELDNEYLLSDQTPQMVIIIHPMYSTAEEDEKKTARGRKGARSREVKRKQDETIDDSDLEKEADYTIDPTDI